jgi:hypothetical protein
MAQTTRPGSNRFRGFVVALAGFRERQIGYEGYDSLGLDFYCACLLTLLGI